MSAEYVKKKIGLLAGQIFFFAYSIIKKCNRMITENLNKIELYINNDWIDTLVLSRLLLSHVKNYKLKSLVEELELEWDYSYRTIDAARLVAKMYLIYVEKLKKFEAV